MENLGVGNRVSVTNQHSKLRGLSGRIVAEKDRGFIVSVENHPGYSGNVNVYFMPEELGRFAGNV
jgi:hypothetical protein